MKGVDGSRRKGRLEECSESFLLRGCRFLIRKLETILGETLELAFTTQMADAWMRLRQLLNLMEDAICACTLRSLVASCCSSVSCLKLGSSRRKW
jgi:hypothetical protein